MVEKELGFKELLAIAIGGMVGGGIFTVLGIAISMVGLLAPFAIALGGVLAFFAAYSYVKMALYYKDEGATYAFFKRTYEDSHLAAAFIGWYTIFGYISTLALYAYTFASYVTSGMDLEHVVVYRKIVAIVILIVFALLNIWSVKRMGEIEDMMVYAKLLILFVISFLFFYFAKVDSAVFLQTIQADLQSTPFFHVIIVASITFVAYEGFQLVTNAVNETQDIQKNIPRAIYGAIILVAVLYFVIALSAVMVIPAEDIIHHKEAALAVGAYNLLGKWGENFVVLGAILATSSAINGTLFGASRQMARIADDHYLPRIIRYRKGHIPVVAIIFMVMVASLLIAAGGLRLILEFGSITFLLVSLLIVVANLKIAKQTQSSVVMMLISIIGLIAASVLIVYNEYHTNKEQLLFIVMLYAFLSFGAWGYSFIETRKEQRQRGDG